MKKKTGFLFDFENAFVKEAYFLTINLYFILYILCPLLAGNIILSNLFFLSNVDIKNVLVIIKFDSCEHVICFQILTTNTISEREIIDKSFIIKFYQGSLAQPL